MVEFYPFGWLHWATLALTAALAVMVARMGRRDRRRRQQLAWGLSAWMTLSVAGVFVHFLGRGETRAWDALPLHLCDISLFLAAAALVTRAQWVYELLYFWGLAGASQAMLTPDLSGALQWWRFAFFFGAHAGVIVTAIFLTLACGMRPRKHAVWRAMGALAVYTAFAALVNWGAGTNYGFLRGKPRHPSLLDHLGAWPWYIGAMGALALVSFTLLYAPFYFRQNRARHPSGHSNDG
jgi:hypothetical integral membrane protein (TIGR02206 family)